MNLSAVGWPGTDTPSRVLAEGGASNGQGWQRSSHGSANGAWQRWATGSMAQPHPGARVLNDAEGWWDASVYEGGRQWRNLGTAGSGGDLVTIGGIGAPMIHNRPTGEAYLRLWGRAAQSVACTAPATAVSYAAYQVVCDSSTPTTGVVTGGAAFSFAPGFAARWTRVDLLDAGSNVVAQWTAAGTVWNGTTWGMTDGFAVVWTVTMYDLSYTNPVLMPADGRPHFSMGVPSPSTVQIAWGNTTSGDLFNVTSGQDMTALVVVQHQAVSGVYGDYMAYALRQASGSDGTVGRWYIDCGYNATTTYTTISPLINGSGLTANYNWSTSGKTGVRFMYTLTTTRQGRSANQYINGSLFATQQLSASMVGTQSGGLFQVGGRNANNSGQGGLTGYLYAAAFFRRSVSANDLAAIAAYYGCQ